MKRELQQGDRVEYAISKIKNLGFEPYDITKSSFKFIFKGAVIQVFPYTGWHTGKTIKDGRGIQNLLNQLNQQP